MPLVLSGAGTIAGINATNGLSSPQSNTVLQVVQTTITTTFNTSSGTFTHATNHSLSITTRATNSRILLICNTPLQVANPCRAQATFRSSIDSYTANIGLITAAKYPDASSGWVTLPHLHYLHSPAQSSGTAITYRVYVRRTGGSDGIYYSDDWGDGYEYSFIAMELAP